MNEIMIWLLFLYRHKNEPKFYVRQKFSYKNFTKEKPNKETTNSYVKILFCNANEGKKYQKRKYQENDFFSMDIFRNDVTSTYQIDTKETRIL